MGKAIIIYESKYGNTKQVAELIAEGMRQVPGTEVNISEAGQLDLNNAVTFDCILLGSPNHMGGPVGSIKKIIDHLRKLKLDNKKSPYSIPICRENLRKPLRKWKSK